VLGSECTRYPDIITVTMFFINRRHDLNSDIVGT
jgi:hypothetical protein